MQAIREEITSICDQHNQATLDLGESSDEGILQCQGRSNTNDKSNDQASKKDSQEDADTLKQANDAKCSSGTTFLVSLGCLEQHNSDSIVENGFSKDDSVQLRVDLIGIEDCQNSDRVRS